MEGQNSWSESTASEVLIFESVFFKRVAPLKNCKTVDRKLNYTVHLKLKLSHVVHIIHVKGLLNA